MTDFQEKKAKAQEAIDAGDKETAVRLLFELTQLCVRNKDFRNAEALRDSLYKVDPGAINEIVKAGEMIEQAKSESMSPGHTALWTDLYGSLSTEEANELYYALRIEHFDINQPLFQRSENNEHLFMIEDGEITLSYEQNGLEMHLKTVGAGEIVGGETFFSRTAVCTFSAIPLSPVQANLLDKALLKRWQQDFPGLHAKLLELWQSRYKVPEILRSMDLDRRKQTRVTLSGSLAVSMTNKEGKPTSRPFRARLEDISTGGLAFVIETRQEETARLLLGRRVAMQCDVPQKNGRTELKKIGTILAVQPLPFNEYSLHVSFEKPVSWGFVNSIDTSMESKSPDLGLGLE